MVFAMIQRSGAYGPSNTSGSAAFSLQFQLLMHKSPSALAICLVLLGASVGALDFTFLEGALRMSRLGKPDYLFINQQPDLQDLLPEHSEIVLAEQNFTDEILLPILKTPTVSKICSQISQGYVNATSLTFGISSKVIIAQKLCANPESGRLFTFGETSQSPRIAADFPLKTIDDLSARRTFFFIAYTGQAPAYQSWTNNWNQTFIAVSPQDLNHDYFTRVLAHEIAISTDSKSSRELLKQTLITSPSNKEMLCDRVSSALHPLIRYSFNVLRALKTESQILRELGLKPSSLFVNDDCLEQVKAILPSVEELKLLILPEMELYRRDLAELSCQMPSDLWTTLQSLQEDFQGGSLCAFLRSPGHPIFSRQSLSPGPRPRVGSGTGNTKLQSDDASLEKINTRHFRMLKMKTEGAGENDKKEKSNKNEKQASEKPKGWP